MAEPLVEIEGLSFRYRRGTEPAIRDLDLRIEPGEVLLVAGPSGCGKSTLIRAINGLVPHAYPGELTGTVRVAGRPTTELRLREIAQTVGTVLQDPAKQIVGATVQAELAFGPENLGLPRDEIRRRLGAVAARAGIEHLVGRETANLSGGERQLVAVAGILMMQPRLYVVDEPLANLDPATASRLLALLRSLADAGDAILIVEHRVEEALELRPDRVLYLKDGRPRLLGSVADFFAVADPAEVKLPFEVVLDRVRATMDTRAPAVPAGPSASASAGDRPETPRLEFDHVRSGFGERTVLHDVTARLGAREVVAVLGPNGSGKTTLFRAAMGLQPVWSGSVAVDGQSIADRAVADLATVFGYVFQSPSQMLFARTVREELAFGPRNLGRPADRFDALAASSIERTGLAGVEGILDRPPLTLSFGQQKRLALAIALTLEPATLILDEPSAGQDHRNAERFMAEVRAIPGLDSLYLITHDVDLALAHADRILLFRDGAIVGDDTPLGIIGDEARWLACNLRVTSLIRANAQRPGSRFMEAEALAERLVREETANVLVKGG